MNTKRTNKQKRKRRIRAVVSGTKGRPRLSLYRSNTSLYVQLVDDTAGKTILAKRTSGKNAKAAQELGRQIAKMALKKSIRRVVFDRGGNRYHGIVHALAAAAREGGLTF